MVYMDKILNKDLPVIIACSYLSNYNAYEIMKKFHYEYDRELSVDQNRVYNYSHKGNLNPYTGKHGTEK